MRRENIIGKIDWVIVLIYFILVIMGWLNIYAAVYDEQNVSNIFDTSLNSGKQLMWIGVSCFVILAILIIDLKFYDAFAFIIYGLTMGLLIFVLIFGREVAGSKSWFELGFIRLQPAEFAKFATGLAIARYLSDPSKRFDQMETIGKCLLICLIPMLLIHLQGDTGSALVYLALSVVFFREGLNPNIFILGIVTTALFIFTLLYPVEHIVVGVTGLAIIIFFIGKRGIKKGLILLGSVIVITSVVFSVDYVVDNVMKPHQQNRVKAFISPESDPMGYGWNVTQSKIAIGSGGVFGKGFLNGTQTKFRFVPEQSTDFIFCTLGEEHGFVGSATVIILFAILFWRIIFIAERSKNRFTRVYAYSVLSIMLFHFFVNIAMTIGLFPVIGIPLPFFSYGGSSLLSFTIFLFILVKLDAHRMELLER
ncbi:rod shape-determining protein RodA [Aureibacter tunicatorum]|uniref:Cell wall polymerase n=1 Tax=Aureibacter tunicatorum TaxID=866807 RepID=A0AAE3XNM9_9BACT|nr:rod shape-determining protein RodA [Aureibacter tunicatorum]MDR6238399.1 rod shape determining protein RodA [Aureibacter tunicatorum]BDD03431.1 rod shape-determining protein RodA [Aureibacter tunicatorum]